MFKIFSRFETFPSKTLIGSIEYCFKKPFLFVNCLFGFNEIFAQVIYIKNSKLQISLEFFLPNRKLYLVEIFKKALLFILIL